MIVLTLVLAVPGCVLLFGGPWIARRVAREDADPVAVARLLQGAGAVLLLLALLAA